MTLDLRQIAPQIETMAQEVGARQCLLARRRELALALLEEWDGQLDELRALVASEQPWLVAAPLDPLLLRRPAPALPETVTAIATDGSALDLDRHGLTQCYLINVGAAVIRYGQEPDAALSSRAMLYYRDEDLYLDDSGSRVPVQGALLDLKRTLAELERALELARERRGQGPAVVVLDGTLLLWQLSGRAAEESFVVEAIGRYAAGLATFRRLGIPVCSYVSRPTGHEVTNLLRLAACPGSRQNCERCRAGQVDCLRDVLEPLPDHLLMSHLQPGERSARFASRSPVLRHYGKGNGIVFVYLHAGPEIARLECPEWVAADETLLDLVHAVIVDGCRRGWGYPPVLAEAHEQAVIRGGDRQAFQTMVMHALNVADLPVLFSAKSVSKNRRAV